MIPYMEIPYYEKDKGIKTYEPPSVGYYVILDRPKVDALDANMWNTFEAVKEECEEELKKFLDLDEAIIAISPDGDPTYILNFVDQPMPNNGGILQ